jgi:hypothetical protein
LTRRRLNTREAAEALGTSVDAVRMRIRRGTLESEHDTNGRLYVWLDVDEAPSDSSALISEMRDRIAFLERELERKDAILLNMTEAMKAIAPPAQEEAPPEPPEASVTATEQPGRVGPQTEVEGTQEGAERPWWRFWE